METKKTKLYSKRDETNYCEDSNWTKMVWQTYQPRPMHDCHKHQCILTTWCQCMLATWLSCMFQTWLSCVLDCSRITETQIFLKKVNTSYSVYLVLALSNSSHIFFTTHTSHFVSFLSFLDLVVRCLTPQTIWPWIWHTLIKLWWFFITYNWKVLYFVNPSTSFSLPP